jgi:hypothetical protein
MTKHQRALLVAGVAVFLACTPSAAQQTAAADQAPIVIFVHGRAQAFKVSSLLREEWFGAFRDGAKKVERQAGFPVIESLVPTGTNLPQGLTESLKFVNYEHIYEPGFVPSVPECNNARDVTETGENEVGAYGIGDAIRKAVRKWLHNAARDDGNLARSLTKLGVKYFLEDTEKYLNNPKYRCETDWQLLRAFDEAKGRPIVLVTHSMGAMVAYDALMHPNYKPGKINIRRWIMVGAQLASPQIIRALMGNQTATLKRPPSVASWHNFFDEHDFVGLEIKPVVDDVRNHAIETDPDRPHWIGGYLKHPATAAAIIGGWCESVAAKPLVCNNVK